MTATTPVDNGFTTRWKWIREIQKSSGKIYFLIFGAIVLLITINIGFHIVDNKIIEDDFRIGLFTEVISIFITIFVLDQINEYRDAQRRKSALFRQTKSRSNDFAVDALDQILDEGLWHDLLAHYTDGYGQVDLNHVQWAGGILSLADLEGAALFRANLQAAELTLVDLQGARLSYANLKNAKLQHANLQDADLQYANLKNAKLVKAKLQGTNLQYANLKNAKLQHAKFDEKTVLPDANWIIEDGEPIYDKYWTPKTDMERFTDPDRPDFWQPDWAKEQETD